MCKVTYPTSAEKTGKWYKSQNKLKQRIVLEIWKAEEQVTPADWIKGLAQNSGDSHQLLDT